VTHAAQYVLAHGAFVLFIWILIQQAGLPIPGAPMLVSIGSLASLGRIDLRSSLATAFCACLLADGFWYGVGRRRWSKCYRFCVSTRNWRHRALGLVSAHSVIALLSAKFIPGPNVLSLMAGRAGISLRKFLVCDGISSLLWSGGFIAIGYFSVAGHIALQHVLPPR